MESEPEKGKLIPVGNGEFEETIAIRSRYDDRKTILILPEEDEASLNPEELNPLQKAVLQGYHFNDLMEAGKASSITDLSGRSAWSEHSCATAWSW